MSTQIDELIAVERIVGFSAIGADSGGLRVSFGLDKMKAFAEIQRRTRHDILLITLSAMMVLVLTLLGARRFIHRPLGSIWLFIDVGKRSCQDT